MVCIKDTELNIKVLSEGLKKDYPEETIKDAILHLVEMGKNVLTDLYMITRHMEAVGLYHQWQTIGLEIEIAKFMHTVGKTHLIDDEATDEEDAFIAMLRAVYTMCSRYFEIKLAFNGEIEVNGKIVKFDKVIGGCFKALPKALDTDKAKIILQKAAEASLCNGKNEWIRSKALLAYFASRTSLYLGLGKGEYNGKPKIAWKPFEQLFGLNGLSGAEQDYQKVGGLPKGYEDVDKLFE